MRTMTLLSSATPTTVANILETARERGWNDVLIRKHGNAVVRRAIDGVAKAKAAPTISAGKRALRPKGEPDFSTATDLQVRVHIEGHGKAYETRLSGKRGIVGPRGSVYALLSDSRNITTRISDEALDRLLGGTAITAFIGERAYSVSLA